MASTDVLMIEAAGWDEKNNAIFFFLFFPTQGLFLHVLGFRVAISVYSSLSPDAGWIHE